MSFFLHGIRSCLASKFKVIISLLIVLLEMPERLFKEILTQADCSLYLANVSDNLATGSSDENVVENGNEVENENGPQPQLGNTAKRLKRIKLLVDITISPKGSSKVVSVSTKDEVMDEEPVSRWSQLVSKLGLASLYLLRAIKRRLIQSIAASPSRRRQRYSQSSSNGGRRTISPRRRLSQLSRFIPHFPFRLLGPREPMTDSLSLSPQQKSAEEAASSFAARTQVVEKRKRPDSTTTDETLYEANECEQLDVQLSADGNQAVNNNREIPSDESEEAGAGAGNEVIPDHAPDSASSSQEYGSPSSDHSDLHKMLNIPEEQYESADDEDYVYPGSTTDDDPTEGDSDSHECLRQEVQDLEADARAALAQLDREIFEALDIEPNIVVGLRDGHTVVVTERNHTEHSNGEASMREPTPPPPPIVPENESGKPPQPPNVDQEGPADVENGSDNPSA